MDAEPVSGRPEASEERADRNLSDLLQELRVALPGVQVLFAFLLTVPFSQRFEELSPFQEKLYFAILCGAALSTALFIAPTAGHRLLFRLQQKEYLVVSANRLTLIGLAVLALSMAGVIALISDLIFGTTASVITASAALIVFGALWYAGPLLRRRELEPIERD